MLKIELGERHFLAILALVVIGILLYQGVVEFSQIENLLYGVVGGLIGRQMPAPGGGSVL